MRWILSLHHNHRRVEDSGVAGTAADVCSQVEGAEARSSVAGQFPSDISYITRCGLRALGSRE